MELNINDKETIDVLAPNSQTPLNIGPQCTSNEPIDILRDGVKVDGYEDFESEDLVIQFDFNSIKTVKNQIKDEKDNPLMSFEGSVLLHKKSKEILIEPLVETYLNLKWQSLKGWWYGYRILFFIAFGVCLTLMMSFIVEMNNHCKYERNNITSGKYWTFSDPPNLYVSINTSKTELNTKVEDNCDKNGLSTLSIPDLVRTRSDKQNIEVAYFINVTIRAYKFWILYAFTAFGVILVTIAELSEAFRDGYRYFISTANWLDFGNLFCAGICLILTWTNYKDTAIGFGCTSVLLSWLIISLAIGDMPIVGNWVYLLGNTVKKVTTFLLVFMPLLFGFGLRFRFMFPTKVDGLAQSLYNAIFSHQPKVKKISLLA